MPLRTGELDRLVSIERDTPTQDSYGQPISSWARIGRKRWASYKPVSGSERFVGEQYASQEQVEFIVRWAEDLATLNTKDRVVYPPETSPATYQIYDILAVHEIGRREGLRIITARRNEQ